MLALASAVSAIAVFGVAGKAAALPIDGALAACMAGEPSRKPSAEVQLDWTDLESMYDRASVARRYSHGWRVVVADTRRCQRFELSAREGRALDRLLARPNLEAELQSANNQRCKGIGGAGSAIEVQTRSRRFKVYADTTCRAAPQTDELLRLAGDFRPD